MILSAFAMCSRSALLPFLLVLTVLLGVATHATAAPAERTVTVITKPDILMPMSGKDGAETLVVIARPGKGQRIHRADLRALPVRGIRFQIIEQPPPNEFPTSNELTWTARIESDDDARAETILTLVLEHRVGADPLPDGTVQVEVATIAVKPASVPRPATVLELALLKGFDALFDQQEGRAYLRLRNLSDAPLTITNIEKYHPAFMAMNEDRGPPWVIPPRSTVLQGLTLSFISDSKSPVVAGIHNVGTTLLLEQKNGSQSWTGGLSVEDKITIGVPFVSEIQGLIQIPSFLILPGALVLTMATTILYYYRHYYQPDAAPQAASPTPLLENKIAAAAMSITISLLIVAFLYPVYTKYVLTQQRNVLIGYGFSDVYHMWFLSLALGGLAAIAWVGRDLYRQSTAARKRALTQFTSGDTPLKVLERLVLLERPGRLSWNGNHADPLFRLGTHGPTPDKEWAVPNALVTYQEEDLQKRAEFFTKLKKTLLEGTTKDLQAELSHALDERSIKVDWAGGNGGPRLIEAITFVNPAEPKPFIEIDASPK